MSGTYKIVEAQLPLIGGIAGHDLIAILNPSGQVLEEFDGLAASASGGYKAIGYLPSDQLKVKDTPGDYFYSSTDRQATLVASDTYSSLTPYINAIKNCAADMNAENLSYPFLGLGANSNSVASTLDACMGVPEPDLGVGRVTPGVGTLLLSPTVINNVAVSNGLGQPPPTTGDSYVSGTFTSATSSTVTVTNGDGTTETASISTSGANGVATLTDNDTAANRVFTQTDTIQSSGATTVAYSGVGDTLANEGATISESGRTSSLTEIGNHDVVDIAAVSVGKLGGASGGTVIFGNDTTGETVNATGAGGGIKVDEGIDSDAIVNGGLNGGMNQVTLSSGDKVLENGWDSDSGGSGDIIDVGANDVTYVNESGVTVVGKGGDTFDVTGTNDHIYADSSNIDIIGSDTGDIVYGSGDTGDTSDWGGYVNEGGGYGGYSGGGYYYSAVARRARSSHASLAGSVAGRGVDIGSIATPEFSRTGMFRGSVTPPTLSSVYLGTQQLIHAMSRWPAETGSLQTNTTETDATEQHAPLGQAPLLRSKEPHIESRFR